MVRRAARLVNRGLARIGIQIARYPIPTEFEVDVIQVIRRLGLGCVIDVGAHDGGFASRLRAIGYQGRIVSLEPTTASYAALARRAAAAATWTVLPIGAGRTSGSAQIHLTADTTFCSILPASEFGSSRFEGVRQVGTETIEIRRLDEIWDQHVGRDPVLLKTDTQGFDLEVIAGAGDRIRDVLAVQIEGMLNPIYRGAPTLDDTRRELERLGYYLASIAPISRGTDMRVVELDTLFLREGALPLTTVPLRPETTATPSS